MPDTDPHDPIGPFARTLIRRKARQLAARPGFTAEDRLDLEQELRLLLLQRLPAFDPGRAHLHAFVTTVVARCAANLVRQRLAAKRDGRPHSLQSWVKTEEGPAQLAATIGQRAYDARRGSYPRGGEELALLAADVADVLARLPQRLRELAEDLKYQTVADVARARGVPRTTLYRDVRRLLSHFDRAGLGDYLGNPSSSRPGSV